MPDTLASPGGRCNSAGPLTQVETRRGRRRGQRFWSWRHVALGDGRRVPGRRGLDRREDGCCVGWGAWRVALVFVCVPEGLSISGIRMDVRAVEGSGGDGAAASNRRAASRVHS